MAVIQTITTTANGSNSIVVPTALSGVTVVWVGGASDADNVHRQLNSVTFDGVAMTSAGFASASGQNNQMDVYFTKNYTGSGTKTLQISYNAPAYAIGVCYVISGTDTTTQLDNPVNPSTSSSTTASVVLGATSTVTGDIIIEALAASNTITVPGTMTVDSNTTGNGSNIVFAHKTLATVGSTTDTWTMNSTYAGVGFAVKNVPTGGTANHFLSLLGVGS